MTIFVSLFCLQYHFIILKSLNDEMAREKIAVFYIVYILCIMCICVKSYFTHSQNKCVLYCESKYFNTIFLSS